MSDTGIDLPQYKMVNGELVELTQDEIDAILAEWEAAKEEQPQ